jgi:hypothetical protein
MPYIMRSETLFLIIFLEESVLSPHRNFEAKVP